MIAIEAEVSALVSLIPAFALATKEANSQFTYCSKTPPSVPLHKLAKPQKQVERAVDSVTEIDDSPASLLAKLKLKLEGLKHSSKTKPASKQDMLKSKKDKVSKKTRKTHPEVTGVGIAAVQKTVEAAQRNSKPGSFVAEEVSNQVSFGNLDFGIATKKVKKTQNIHLIQKLSGADAVKKTPMEKALILAGGGVVKDDLKILKKAVKRVESGKRKSAGEWKGRLDGVEREKIKKQTTRDANIRKRYNYTQCRIDETKSGIHKKGKVGKIAKSKAKHAKGAKAGF